LVYSVRKRKGFFDGGERSFFHFVETLLGGGRGAKTDCNLGKKVIVPPLKEKNIASTERPRILREEGGRGGEKSAFCYSKGHDVG